MTRSYTPRGQTRLRLPRGGSVLVHRRTRTVGLALLLIAAAAAAGTLVTGEYHLSVADALRVFVGGGDSTDRFFVLQQRLPRVVAAALVGAALAVSGALFQTVARNSLASPDIVGFTTGAATGGLVAILLVGRPSSSTVLVGALAGGAATALLVVLVVRGKGMTGDRLILGGIAVAAMLAAVNDYLISRAPLESAEAAKAWQHGSLHNITWADVLPLAVVLAAALPCALALGRALCVLELGDDAAAGIGLAVPRTRLLAISAGLVLAGAAVATAGPIGFLALAAPQLARRLTRAPGVPLAATAAMGVVLLVIADLLAQRLLSPFDIPVGLVTAAVGGAYLLWLLVTDRA